jgi:pimeloyl-ACP methyl ester carboxylesterase
MPPSFAQSFTAPPIQTWTWNGLPITYQVAGDQGAAVVLVHGFGASLGHWRKNISELAQGFRVYAIDLLGFGGSAKPQPGQPLPYTFETWGQQLVDFCQAVVGEPMFLIGNSIGCIAAMQAAVMAPNQVRGIAMLDCSLRLLHDRRRATQPWIKQVGTPILQRFLQIRWLGHTFFKQIAHPQTVRKVLLQAYGRKEAVTDELINLLMQPAADPGAPGVFLAFTGYSQGPLPEDLLPQLTCPVLILWGDADPWEPIALGRELANFPCVEQFIALEGVGHCPQDEAPEVVNPILLNWLHHSMSPSF